MVFNNVQFQKISTFPLTEGIRISCGVVKTFNAYGLLTKYKVKFFFGVFTDLDEVEVHKLAEKERSQYPAILTEQTWSIKDLLYGFWCILLAGYSG